MYRVVTRDNSVDPYSNILYYIQGTKEKIQGPHIQSVRLFSPVGI